MKEATPIPGPAVPVSPASPPPAEPAVAPLTLSLEQIFEKYAPRVYSLARRMLANDADAQDVTQDVFLQVVRHLPTFRGEAAFTTWLHRITVNAALAFRRKRVVREKHRVTDPLDQFLEDGRHRAPVRRWDVRPEQLILDQETHQLIEDAVAQLPESYRDVFVLADIEELPNAEIAELLGLSLGAVKSRLHRARLLLRNLLAPHFEESTA